ncbi:MAG: aminopeptidase [Bacteroidetes bacterium]|nr:aminopeptidase [Bacteroidota bacterium]
MSQQKLNKACRIAIKDCMAAKKGERVLVVTDQKKYEIGRALHLTAMDLGYESLLIEMKAGEINGEEPAKEVAELMQSYDVVLCPTEKSLTHTDARRNASAKGVRVATFPGITKDIMIRGLSADYKKIQTLTLKLKKLFEKTKIIHITSQIGTDIKLDITGRKAIASKGLFHRSGEGGNLPTGETFAAPLEGTTNGVFVVDGSMAGIGVIGNTPIKITVENGYATAITGGAKAKKLRTMLEKYGKEAFSIAEIGIGANDKAKLSGFILEDEKVLGTAHIALGNNITMGGHVNVPIHLDGVIKKPTIFFDKKEIMRKGKLLI